MRKKLFKTIYVCLFCISVLNYYSCSDDSNSIDGPPAISQQQKIAEFEKEFIKSYYDTIPSSANSLKLSGFKTYPISEEERGALKELYSKHKDVLTKAKNTYYAEDFSYIRIYFPLSGAIINYNGVDYEADENGLVNLKNSDSKAKVAAYDVKLIGRKQSENVVGTETNIIQGNRIILEKQLHKSTYQANNYYVFDTGERTIGHGEHHVGKTRGGGVSCYKNHNNKNCSTAFGINKGRCAFKANICMDYNGWYTDCVNGKVSNFPGSDCDYAMGRGHCWNELM